MILKLIECYFGTDIQTLEWKNKTKLSNLSENSIEPLSCGYLFGWSTTDFPIGFYYNLPWVPVV